MENNSAERQLPADLDFTVESNVPSWDVPPGATKVASHTETCCIFLYYPGHGWFDLCDLGGYDTLEEVIQNG